MNRRARGYFPWLAAALAACAAAPRAPDAGPEAAAARALVAEGERLLRAGANAEALEAAQRAVALAPGEFEPRRLEQEALLRLGRVPEARAAAEERVRLAGDGASYALLARVESGPAARAAAEQAVASDPELAWAYVARGQALARDAEFERAAADFTEALELDPALAVARLYRARVRDQLADFEGAADDYRIYLRSNGGDKDSRFCFASILHRELNRPAEAEEQYRILRDLDPRMSEAIVGLAVRLTEQRRYAEAESLYLSVADRDLTALFNLGMLYEDQLGSPDAAAACFERFLADTGGIGGEAFLLDRLIYAPVLLERARAAGRLRQAAPEPGGG